MRLDFKNITTVHLVGIKGVGMTALACLCQDKGITVSGSDVAESFPTERILRKRRIKISPCFLAGHIKRQKAVVYSAGHDGIRNVEVTAAIKKGIPVITQAELLGLFAENKPTIAVIGVGGKSTTAAMLATVFSLAGCHPSYFVGAAAINPLGDPGKFDPRGRLFIAEADEYFDPKRKRPKFLNLRPAAAILTNLAYDHPDVYPDLAETKRYFRLFLNRIPDGGLVVANGDDPVIRQSFTGYRKPKLTVGFSLSNDAVVRMHASAGRMTEFSLSRGRGKDTYAIRLPGKYNVLNAAGAVLMAQHWGLTKSQIKTGLAAYRGITRRLEKIWEGLSYGLYDDYAHHPLQIRALLAGCRPLFYPKKIIVIFQSHTYSRTKALLAGFAQSFKNCDVCLVTEIFCSAREKDGSLINGRKLYEKIRQVSRNAVFCPDLKDIAAWLKQNLNQPSVVLTVGAGNLFHWHGEIIKILKAKEKLNLTSSPAGKSSLSLDYQSTSIKHAV